VSARWRTEEIADRVRRLHRSDQAECSEARHVSGIEHLRLDLDALPQSLRQDGEQLRLGVEQQSRALRRIAVRLEQGCASKAATTASRFMTRTSFPTSQP